MSRLSRAIKKLSETIEVMVAHFAQGRPLRYFCTDESRWGLKTLTGRVITLRGVKPVALVQWPLEAFWLYGAVEPLTGAHFFYSFSHLDAVCFNRFVEQFAAAFSGSLNLLQLDQASAHIALEANWPDNVVPLFQPAHSPATQRAPRPPSDFGKTSENISRGKSLPPLTSFSERSLLSLMRSLTRRSLP